MREAQNINRSLSALGDVLEALDHKSRHIPYRNSTLTFLLQNSLTSSARTLMIITVCPTDLSQDETLYALNFAHRLKNLNLAAAGGSGGKKGTPHAAIRTLQDALSKAKLVIRENNLKRHGLEESVLGMSNQVHPFFTLTLSLLFVCALLCFTVCCVLVMCPSLPSNM